VRLSTAERLALLAFGEGVVVGGAAAWFAWRLIRRGERIVGISVAGLAGTGALALWSAVTGR
jgi:hypothetical protein